MKRLTFATALLSALFALGQDAPKAQLRVRLATDRVSCSLHGSLNLEVVRENTGSGSLFIYRRWEWGALSKIRVFDSKGNEITDVLWAVDDPPPLTSSDFILLNPGEFLGTRLNVTVGQFVKNPGDYEFLVEYRSYLPEDLARKYSQRREVPFWSRERDKLTSNKIKLRVTD